MPGFFMGRLAGHRLARHAVKNLKENMAVELDLVKLKAGWRIDEIRTKTGSLRDLFKKK